MIVVVCVVLNALLRCSTTSVMLTPRFPPALNSRVSSVCSLWTWFGWLTAAPDPGSATPSMSAGLAVVCARLPLSEIASATAWRDAPTAVDSDDGEATLISVSEITEPKIEARFPGTRDRFVSVPAVASAFVACSVKPGTVSVASGMRALSLKSFPSAC